MVPKTSYPPTHPHPHLTCLLSPNDAQQNLTLFLSQTSRTPHLHPDATLSTSGVAFSASSGPKGGLALHHLDRIARGLKGEELVLEAREELEAKFGEVVDGSRTEKGDDTRVDGVIAETEKGLKKRKREADVEAWAAETESANGAGGEGEGQWEGAQELEEYEHEQRPLIGEVGERGTGEVRQQGGEVPEVVEARSREVTTKKSKSEQDKKARKLAKKARSKAEKSKDRKKGDGDEAAGGNNGEDD